MGHGGEAPVLPQDGPPPQPGPPLLLYFALLNPGGHCSGHLPSQPHPPQFGPLPARQPLPLLAPQPLGATQPLWALWRHLRAAYSPSRANSGTHPLLAPVALPAGTCLMGFSGHLASSPVPADLRPNPGWAQSSWPAGLCLRPEPWTHKALGPHCLLGFLTKPGAG